MTVDLFISWIHAPGLDVLVRCNGYPVARANEEKASESRRVNDLLVDGPNTLTVDVRRPTSTEDPVLAAWLRRYVEGTEDHLTLVETHQHPPDLPPADGTAHETLRHVFTLDGAFGRWSWQDARPYAATDMPAIVATHRAYRDAAKAGDVAALVALSRTKVEEISRSVEEDAQDGLERHAETWQRLLAMEGGRLVVADDDDLVATSWSDGRLVDVTTTSGDAPLYVTDGHVRANFGYVISMIEGRAVVVR